MKYIKTFETFSSEPPSKGAQIELAHEEQRDMEDDMKVKELKRKQKLEEEKEKEEDDKGKEKK